MKCVECGKELTNETDCYGHDCEVKEKRIKEFFKVPIYYTIIKGKIVYDEDSIRDIFETRLKEILNGERQ
jgi:hypothetical protein